MTPQLLYRHNLKPTAEEEREMILDPAGSLVFSSGAAELHAQPSARCALLTGWKWARAQERWLSQWSLWRRSSSTWNKSRG